jgi:uncharacterized membrane protein
LRTGEHAGGIKYSEELFLPLALFVASLACDLSHYLYKTAVTGALNFYFWRKYKNDDEDVPYSGKWNWPTLGLFWLKAGLVVVAYAYLFNFIYVQLTT